jgi:proline iminopeptidase
VTRVRANGIEIDCEDWGDPSAPPLVLVMGLGMPAALWPEEFIGALVQSGHRVVTFDNRDCGGSTRFDHLPPGNVLRGIFRALTRRPVAAHYSLDDMAADTVGVMDALGIRRAHVVGASMGGMIGQVVAARYPDRVWSLTSIMSNTGNPDRRLAFGDWRALRAITAPPPPPDDHAAVVRHLIRVFGAIGSPGLHENLARLQPIFERVAERGLSRPGTERQLLAILRSGDRRELLRRIVAPTLVLHGALDPLVPPAAGRDTAATIPGATLELVDGMGHDFPPDLMAQLALRIVAHCRAAEPAGLRPVAAPRSVAATR